MKLLYHVDGETHGDKWHLYCIEKKNNKKNLISLTQVTVFKNYEKKNVENLLLFE